jgi:hypothetical protein
VGRTPTRVVLSGLGAVLCLVAPTGGAVPAAAGAQVDCQQVVRATSHITYERAVGDIELPTLGSPQVLEIRKAYVRNAYRYRLVRQ